MVWVLVLRQNKAVKPRVWLSLIWLWRLHGWRTIFCFLIKKCQISFYFFLITNEKNSIFLQFNFIIQVQVRWSLSIWTCSLWSSRALKRERERERTLLVPFKRSSTETYVLGTSIWYRIDVVFITTNNELGKVQAWWIESKMLRGYLVTFLFFLFLCLFYVCLVLFSFL